jgi:hypothetical protein
MWVFTVSTLKEEVLHSSETSVLTSQITQCLNPKDHNMNCHSSNPKISSISISLHITLQQCDALMHDKVCHVEQVVLKSTILNTSSFWYL